jgi:hypothetical protein
MSLNLLGAEYFFMPSLSFLIQAGEAGAGAAPLGH